MNKRVIFLIVLAVLIIIGLLVALLIGQQAQPNSVSRAVICANQKDYCYNECEQKFIGYFCNKDCDKAYEQCMGSY